MSREVDERVVQMQFDNAQFERGTRQTMGTLEKLKQSLQFKGVEKGFERISSASQKVDFSEMTKALESIESKFSAVNVIAVTALTSITNKAIATGERLVKALSLDPIISGFQEYETQINAVQTILANTSSKGTTLDQVNAALDELNHYADLTIYNFTEMTRNIGTFTAAGVDLDTSVAAIKGIANLAVSGSTSQQASTAMYQLSQALASGTVKLQDWNSVVNAGMGGQVFQDALKETARVHGVAIDSMIAKEGSFRETLSKGWLTSSILTETLQKFTGDLNEETLKSIGYTDEQIKKIMEMGKTANDAATKVKTFSQLKDTLAEALQSGWTQTWQTVIGDFEEAKELFTKFSDVFSDLINKSSEARNTVLEGGLNSGWQQLSTALGDSADFYSQMLEKVMLANGSISQKQIDDAGSFAKALQQGGVSAEQLQNGLDESTQQLQALSKLSDKELMAKGLDPTQVKALAKSFEEVNQKIADGTAPSVSLEGGTLWLLQSLPVAPQQVLRVKVELQLLLTLPGAWFCAGCAMAALRIPAGQGLLVLAVLAAFVWLTAQMGLALGLCLPNLHWVSEAAVVKQSAASMLAMFGGWLLAGGVLFLPLTLLDYAVPPLAAQTVCLAVLLGLDLLLHRWLCTRGAARFAALH